MGVIFNEEQRRLSAALNGLMQSYGFKVVRVGQESGTPIDLDYLAEKFLRYTPVASPASAQ